MQGKGVCAQSGASLTLRGTGARGVGIGSGDRGVSEASMRMRETDSSLEPDFLFNLI